jgi:hypothetical protein
VVVNDYENENVVNAEYTVHEEPEKKDEEEL